MSNATAQLRHEPGYFNAVAYANIPECVTIYPDDGSPSLACDGYADAFAVAKRFGYTLVGRVADEHRPVA